MYEMNRRIKELRERSGMSQQKLAELLGVSRPAISQIESGQRKVSADEMRKLADAFHISADRLLDLEEEPVVIIKESKEVYTAKPKIRINVPQKNLEKFKEVLIYILNKVGSKPNIGETVIYKLCLLL